MRSRIVFSIMGELRFQELEAVAGFGVEVCEGEEGEDEDGAEDVEHG
jgi:hypothetical protein